METLQLTSLCLYLLNLGHVNVLLTKLGQQHLARGTAAVQDCSCRLREPTTAWLPVGTHTEMNQVAFGLGFVSCADVQRNPFKIAFKTDTPVCEIHTHHVPSPKHHSVKGTALYLPLSIAL